MDRHDSDADGSLSNDGELSDAELQDDESEDGAAAGDPPSAMVKLKQEVCEEAPLAAAPVDSQLESVLRSLPPWKDWGRDDREELERELKAVHAHAHAHSQPQSRLPSPPSPRAQPVAPSPAPPSSMFPPPPLSMPLPFPFQHPAAAFLPPNPAAYSPAPAPPSTPVSVAAAAVHNNVSSASSHSSESSSSSQQTWSFEEQFKQLYEIDDNPKRKEFLDDLFGYMQKRGTPINRLPIMAKSVLDLYELYNLVIARGGLVDVINKKLWQEIIKGLHLPSSITSAAFTLRTQYMKYLYPYECEKRRLSTPAELQAAIDGNRREGRRTSYGSYTDMIQRGPLPGLPPTHHSQMSPLSLVTSSRAAVNGNSHHHHHHHHHPHHPHHHHPSPHHPSHPQPLSQPLGTGPIPGLVASELENRMAEYVKMIHKEFRGSTATPPSIRQGSNSPPTSTSPQESALSVVEMSRLTLWNLYGNGAAPPAALPPPPEPQREALDLGVREQQSRAAPRDTVVKREREEPRTAPPAKRVLADEDEGLKPVTGTHIKIASRGDARSGSDNSLVVSMELNGTMYQGVLFAQTTRTHMT